MVIACPACGARLTLPDDAASRPGRKALCPGCSQVFLLEQGKRVASAAPRAARPADPPPPPSGPASNPAPRPTVPPPAPPRVAVPAPAQPPRPAAASPAPAPSPAVPPAATRVDDAATRRMTTLDFPGMADGDDAPAIGLAGAPASLEEAMAMGAPLAIDAWEVDRKDYAGATFSLLELADLVKRGWLDRTDGIRPAGTAMWTSAAEQPKLAQAFAVRRKADEARSATDARKRGALACANHPKVKARWRCPGCARAFCGNCGNESELGDRETVLCLECDEPLTAI